MSTQHIPVQKLKNIGPKTAAMLEEAGIYTKKNLIELGPVLTYKILQHRFQRINLIALYALYGAVHDIHWNSIPPEAKAKLQEASREEIDVRFK